MAFVVIVAIGVFGILRYDLTVSVDYKLARVLSVQVIPGADAVQRFAVVDLGTYQRAIRTSDPYVATEPGGPICIKRRQLLLRRWVRHSAAMMVFCRNAFGALPPALTDSAPLVGPAPSP